MPDQTGSLVVEDIFSGDDDFAGQFALVLENTRPSPVTVASDYLTDADADQTAFIESHADTIRLLAPAGSGKTQSIVNRVLAATRRGVPLDAHLILTFDNSAALSLREKFSRGLTAAGLTNVRAPTIQTLNAFGYTLLRGQLTGLAPAVTIGPSPDQDRYAAIRRALRELRAAYPTLHALLPRNLAHRVYLDFISALKNEVIVVDRLTAQDASSRKRLIDLHQRIGILNPWLAPHQGTPAWPAVQRDIVNTLIALYRSYDQIMHGQGRIDFDDQKLLAYLALESRPDLVRSVLAQVTHVTVDEFQDINYLDFAFVQLVAGNRSLTVVGDDDQAIYAFRGCTPDYIINFEDLSHRQTETFVLTTNYRCPSNVVTMGNKLISHNERRVPKIQRAHRSDTAEIGLWHCLNSASEAQVIARYIKHWYTTEVHHGRGYGDVAVLLRINSQSLPLQLALILEDIPYYCRKEDNIVVSTAMKTLLGLMDLHRRLQADPNLALPVDTDLLAKCLVPYARPHEIEALHNAIVRAGGMRPFALRNSFEGAGRIDGEKARQAIARLLAPATPLQFVEAVAEEFPRSLGGMFGTLEDALNNDLPLGEFVDIASRFRGTLSEFHDKLAALIISVEGGLYHSKEGDAVNLLTYFRAKGRQWHTVILPGVNQKVIPHGRAQIEDERRLFYVAVTRPTSSLIVSYVRKSVREAVEPSQFIKEMGLGDAVERRARVLT